MTILKKHPLYMTILGPKSVKKVKKSDKNRANSDFFEKTPFIYDHFGSKK
jgi:hypothetical protein